MKRRRRAFACAAIALAAMSALTARADAGEKQFGYVYEPATLPPGQVELEQWVTPRLGKAGGFFAAFDLRTEIEVGIVDDLQTSLYLNFKNTRAVDARVGKFRPTGMDPVLLDHDGKTTFSDFEFEGISNEWLYKLSDPVADSVGVAAYFEWTTNGQELELEEKLIVASTWGGLTLAANIIFEQEWRARTTDEAHKQATFACTLGAAYRFADTPFTIGVEFRQVNILDEMNDYDHSVFSIGPTFHYAAKHWWATLTFMPQILSATPTRKSFDYDAFEVFEARLIVGVEF